MKQLNINQFREWIKHSAKKDSVDFDFHGFLQEKTKIVFEKQELKTCSCSEEIHLNLRVLKGDCTGTSYTKNFSKKNLEDCYERAMNSLNFSDKKEKGALGKSEKYKDFSQFYNEDFNSLSVGDKIKQTETMMKSALELDKRVQPVHSVVTDMSTQSFFGNSEGAQSLYKLNNVMATCDSLALQKESRSNSYSESTGRAYKDIDFKKVGREAAAKTLDKLNSDIPKTKRYPVIFQTGPAVGGLLLFLTNLMNGKAVFEGMSCLKKDFLNDRIFSEQFSLYDDPFALWGFYASPFDGEGFPTEKTPLVQKGGLKNYLTNFFFSKVLKTPHTKNACWDNKGALGISASNLVMLPGENSFEDLVKEFPQVIIIDDLHGLSGYNPVSGDFSKEAEGFLWERGEKRPLHQFTVSGNIKELFSSILKVGADNTVYNGRVKAPSFLVPDLMIAGK